MASTTIELQIADLQRAAARFSSAVRRLSAKQFLERINGWTPRDIVAHLIGWNRHCIRGSRQILVGELPFYDIDPGEDYSRVNAESVARYASTNRRLLLDELEVSVTELEGSLRSLSAHDWGHDFGVRNRGEVVTIQGTIDELIADYYHHQRQLDELV